MDRYIKFLRVGAIVIILAFLGISRSICQVNSADLSFVSLFNSSMNQDVACYRIPALLTAKNGNLIAAIDERVPSCRDLKWSDDINIVIRYSKDNGQNWSQINRIVDYPIGKSASDPSMILDETTGAIFLFYNYMDLVKEKDIYYLHMIKSEDNGMTWSSPVDITSQVTKSEWANDFKFITSGRGVQTRKGTLIHSLVNIQNGTHLFKSDDHGITWELIETPLKPGDESKFVELSDGSWMVNSRVNRMKARHVHISKDRGLTWDSYPDNQLVDPGCNASIIRYDYAKSGKNKSLLLFTNANSTNKRENLTIRYSTDDGQTWNKGRTIYSGKSAYSEMTILKNGDVGLLFEQDGYEDNVFVKMTLDWITAGEIQ